MSQSFGAKVMGAVLGAAMAGMSAGGAVAQSGPVKIGLVTTLSGPGAGLGIDIRDGFELAVKLAGGKLGDAEVDLLVRDDQQKPDVTKQLVDELIKRDQVEFMTGIVFSNLMLAVGPDIFAAKTFYISANAGPSQYAGAECSPYFFNVAWQNDNLHEAMGQHVQSKAVPSVALVAPNYPAGKDALTGFKRFFKGEVVEETYTQLGQLDYAAEIAQIRASGAKGVYAFLPGGMGISFIKQYVGAGLDRSTPLFLPGFSADEDVLRGLAGNEAGLFNSTHWALELDNAANRTFVAEFEKAYGRKPSLYASQGYDAALLIGSAIESVGRDKLSDKAAVQKALAAAGYDSVRGDWRFNANQYPVQDYYLRETAVVDGKLTNRLLGAIFEDHADAYVGECKMAAAQ